LLQTPTKPGTNARLTPVLRGRFWIASVDMYGMGHNKGRALSSLSATDNTSLGAVSKLVEMLEGGRAPNCPMPSEKIGPSFRISLRKFSHVVSQN
jgi:hypothetical protein